MIEITPVHLKQIESGRINPSIEVLHKIVFRRKYTPEATWRLRGMLFQP